MPVSRPAVLPHPRQILVRLLLVWGVGLVVFGYGLAVVYGKSVWLLNEEQWRWVYRMYAAVLPIGIVGVFLLPWLWYRPIHRVVEDWARGRVVTRAQCAKAYERALLLPWQVALSAFATTFFEYLLGAAVVSWQTSQPLVEVVKALPAIPLIGGVKGMFCCFGTAQVLEPVVSRCSVQLRHARPVRRVSVGAKFLATACILAVAGLCLVQPSAYTLGQVMTEQRISDRALTQLQAAASRAATLRSGADRVEALLGAKLGPRGYVVAVDAEGRVRTPHPLGYTHLAQERFYDLTQHWVGRERVWVDRVGEHRVVAFVRLDDPPWTFVSVSFLTDFDLPLRQFIQFSWLVALAVLLLVLFFGHSFTRSITAPLAELTSAVRTMSAPSAETSQHVPVTTSDEVSEAARSFNQMAERLQASKGELDDYMKRLERSTQELTTLNQEMEELLRIVSHDLHAPLINIQGFSKRLEPVMQEAVQILDELATHNRSNGLRSKVESLKGTVQHQFSESLRLISKSVDKMNALLVSLRGVSRVGRKADPLQPQDLDAVVDDVLAIVDHQLKERSIQVIRHPLPRYVPCRRNEINQVFSNLVSNAINYMGPTTRRVIEIGAREREGEVECFVRDTGVGIDLADHERIFQMFTRLQTIPDVPGEGIGLAYVRRAIQSHGGRIWVESQPGQGSAFIFTLPNRPMGVGVGSGR